MKINGFIKATSFFRIDYQSEKTTKDAKNEQRWVCRNTHTHTNKYVAQITSKLRNRSDDVLLNVVVQSAAKIGIPIGKNWKNHPENPKLYNNMHSL